MLSWLLWLIGLALAVVIGLTVFNIYPIPAVTNQITSVLGSDGLTKALFVSLALLAVSKITS